MNIGIIPCRYDSTRFPGKAIADICGKPMIQWVWESAMKADRLDRVVVATDSDKIAVCAEDFGAEVVLTGRCDSGTERCEEAVSLFKGEQTGVIVNIQADEPMISPKTISKVVRICEIYRRANVPNVTTAFWWSEDHAEFLDPNVVKMVTRYLGTHLSAMYFSRSPVPHQDRFFGFRKHVGIYAFSDAHLLRMAASANRTPEGEMEKLEQLKFLQSDIRILVVEAASDSLSVDTPEDLRKVHLHRHSGNT